MYKKQTHSFTRIGIVYVSQFHVLPLHRQTCLPSFKKKKWHNRQRTSRISLSNAMVVNSNQTSTWYSIEIQLQKHGRVEISRAPTFLYWWWSFYLRFFQFFHFVGEQMVKRTWDCSLKFIEIWQHLRRAVKFTVTAKFSFPHAHHAFRSRVENEIHFINSILSLKCNFITDPVNWMFSSTMKCEWSGEATMSSARWMRSQMWCKIKWSKPKWHVPNGKWQIWIIIEMTKEPYAPHKTIFHV